MLPSDSYKWDAVEMAARYISRLYNAKRVRTPVFESADLFLRSAGEGSDIVNKEMYVFEDKGGRKMALRPEGTAGVVRSFIENNLGETLPLKTYYIESVYRYEQPQAGRYREHHQFGAEFFGSELPQFDLEAICMAYDFLTELGFKSTVQINSIGCSTCRAEYNRALREFLGSVEGEICSDCRRRAVTNPLRALDCKVEKCKQVYKNAPKISDYLCDDCKKHHAEVISGLDAAGVYYVQNDKLVRGLDYYTRTVFEIEGDDFTLLGGGRYDNLTEQLGGKPTPCVGFGCGIERLIDAADKLGLRFDRRVPDVFVAAQCDGARGVCRDIVKQYRSAGIASECDLMNKSLKAQFKYADRANYRFVVTIGESEMESGVYTIKRMADGKTFQIQRESVLRDTEEVLCQE